MVFSSIGERRAVCHGLPHLSLARAGIAISILSIVGFTAFLLVINNA